MDGQLGGKERKRNMSREFSLDLENHSSSTIITIIIVVSIISTIISIS